MVVTLNIVCDVANGMSNICMVFFKSFIGVKSQLQRYQLQYALSVGFPNLERLIVSIVDWNLSFKHFFLSMCNIIYLKLV